MASRYKQLLQQLEDAKVNGDDDKIEIIKQELFLMNKAEGGVTLDFEEANVRDSMFTGGAAMRGRNFSGNY
jgi:hypothetical protein|tara:strand:+ start:42 stop:254 length:213 start_codon:yes stop_codon:yes gene_type:complete